MWNDLDKAKKNEYKKMILGFASLTEMFAQKAESEEEVILSPIINSKYQETVFQRVFEASAEDIGNTAYDVALKQNINGKEIKYLIGIKTFGIFSGNQKIAQFKGYHDEFSNIINTIKNNAVDGQTYIVTTGIQIRPFDEARNFISLDLGNWCSKKI